MEEVLRWRKWLAPDSLSWVAICRLESFKTFWLSFIILTTTKVSESFSDHRKCHRMIVDLVYSSARVYSVCMMILHRYASISSPSGYYGTVQTLVSSLRLSERRLVSFPVESTNGSSKFDVREGYSKLCPHFSLIELGLANISPTFLRFIWIRVKWASRSIWCWGSFEVFCLLFLFWDTSDNLVLVRP